jgi:lipid-A-disaccharide synthase
MTAPCVMLVAVEPSGDALGASLAAALRARLGPEMRFVGVGGPAMAGEGIESPFDPSSMAVVGAFNAIAAWPEVRARARQTAALAAREHPDVAVLIDAWGFNLRVAARLREVDPGLPLIKYVAPQVWATRPGRARTLARRVDRLLTIHSFDAPYFEREGLPTTFVGNPTLQRDLAGADPVRLRQRLGLAPDAPLLLVLPGSREGEVRRLMGPFGDAAAAVTKARPDVTVAIAAAPSVAAQIRLKTTAWALQPIIVENGEDRLAVMRAATVALACSGTVTTELALAGCPMVVAYKLGPFTYVAARLLLRTQYITLLNVAAGRFVAPERIQGKCRGDILARDLLAVLITTAAHYTQISQQSAALEIMRGGIEDPIGAAADAIVEVLKAQPRASSGM